MECKNCNISCVKNGFQTNGKQRYKCKICLKNYQLSYAYKAYLPHIDKFIYKLITNGCNISAIGRVLEINRKTVIKRIIQLASKIKSVKYNEINQQYEIDEVRGRLFGKDIWLTYGINRATKKVIAFTLGDRKNITLSKVVNQVLKLSPLKIYTDGWRGYKSLIPHELHSREKYQTNNIERENLNLRTHLSCLYKKSICCAKSVKYIESALKLYWYGDGLYSIKH